MQVTAQKYGEDSDDDIIQDEGEGINAMASNSRSNKENIDVSKPPTSL